MSRLTKSLEIDVRLSTDAALDILRRLARQPENFGETTTPRCCATSFFTWWGSRSSGKRTQARRPET